ncbi:MAG: ABC transporter permease [Gemmataceae bacterium]
MKQFLAVLKDSYREARDAKIIYVMVVFALLLALLVGTVRYRPLSPQEVFSGGPIKTLNSAFGLQRRFAQPGMALPPVFAVENLKQTNDAPEPWKGSYEFDFIIRYDKASDREGAKAQNLPPFDSPDEVESLYSNDEFYFLKGVKATVLPKTPTENRFHVTVEGTRISDARSWLYEPELLFGATGLGTNRSMRSCVYYVEKWLVQEIGAWVAILVGVIVTSSFIPNMLRKGTLDLFISKPITRVTLLIYKYVGGLSFMLMITAFTVGGVWLAIGLSTGIWSPGFLWVIPAMVFYFAILYAVSTLIAVVSRSSILAILATCVMWGIFWGNGYAHGIIEQVRDGIEIMEKGETKAETPRQARRASRRSGLDEERVKVKERWRRSDGMGVSWIAIRTSDVLYTLLPRTSDLDDFTANMIGRNVMSKEEAAHHDLHTSAALFDWYELNLAGTSIEYPIWLETLVFSVGFIVVLLALACWRFVRMDA